MNDVYGVTVDLKVYYCKNNTDSKLGNYVATKDDVNRKVFDNSSSWANYLKEKYSDVVTTDENGNILYKNLNAIQNLTLNANDTNSLDFSELYNFTSLKVLKLYNYDDISLKGCENLAFLENLYIENCNITDYSAISNLSSLTHLYLLKSNNENVERLSSALANSSLSNLQNFGIADNISDAILTDNRAVTSNKTDVTDISSLTKISETTKNAVKYLWLNNNQITNLNGIENFKNVYQLVIFSNRNLVNLSGLENMTELKFLYSQYCDKLQNIENLKNCSKLDTVCIQNCPLLCSLDGLENARNLKFLYASSCNINDASALVNTTELNILNLNSNVNLQNIASIQNNTKLYELHLKDDNNIAILDIRQISNLINKCSILELPSKYYSLLDGITRREYRNMNLTDTSDEILALEGDTTCTELSLEGNLNLCATEEGKKNFIKILASMTNLKALQLKGIKNLDSIEWIKTMPNLMELDLRGTAITDLTLLNTYAKNLETLLIDNEDIELSAIQDTINNLGDKGYSKTLLGYHNTFITCGLQIFNQKLADKLLECTEITRFYFKENSNLSSSLVYDFSNCIKLKDFNSKYHCTIKYILPESVENIKFQYVEKWPDLSRCRNIKKFYFGDVYGADDEKIEELFKELGKCANLSKVEIIGYHYSKVKGIENLANTTIEEITISGAYNTGWTTPLLAPLNNIDGIGNLKTLKSLTMNYTSIKNLDALVGLENLENLNMYYGQVNNISGIANCTKLKKINFYGDNKIQHSMIYDLEPLTNLTNLEELDLYYNSVQSLHGLENLKKLVSLNLNNNSVTNIATTSTGIVNNMDILVNLNKNKLRKLYLSNNKIDDFSALQKITNWQDKSGW